MINENTKKDDGCVFISYNFSHAVQNVSCTISSENLTPECELDTYEAVAYEEQFTFDDLKNVLTSNEIKMLRQHFIEGYSIKEISIANSMKIGTGTMKFSRMYKKIKNSKC